LPGKSSEGKQKLKSWKNNSDRISVCAPERGLLLENIMAGRTWTEEEIQILINLHQDMKCSDIAKILNRSIRSVQHKFGELSLKKRRAQIGDIVKGWKIIDIYYQQTSQQKVAIAKVKSTLGDETEKEIRLTKLTLEQVGWPDTRRPDLVKRNQTHGESNTRLYRIWSGMLSRSLNEKVKTKYYKNVTVCKDWIIFENFRDWANQNGYSDELSLDRIDFDGSYYPDNCRWANRATQIENRRCSEDIQITAFGETKSIYQWRQDDRCKASYGALKYRIKAGWDHEKALTKESERNQRLGAENWLKLNYPDIHKEWKDSYLK